MQQQGSLFDRIIRLIESGGLKLPVYNPVLIKLQAAAADNTEDIGEIERLIMSDQAMAAEVLRAANSPFFCGLSPVRTIRTAIVRLGTRQIRRLIILASECAKYKARSPALHKMLSNLWRHASTTALAAQWLSKRLRLTGIEEICFLGGLLHDIGKHVILKSIDEIEKKEKSSVYSSPDVINEILLTAHCQLGHKMLQDWNVPEIYCQIARDHHLENLLSGDLPLTIVRLANQGSNKLGLGLNSNPSLDLAATPEAKLLEVGEELLGELLDMLENHLTIAA
jgi:putative nucleotidyltransferase with HDIG domain